MDINIVRMMQSGEYTSAIESLNEIISEDLENYEAILGVAISLLEAGRLDEAKKALDHFHNNTEATYDSYEALGIYYIRVDDYDLAETYLKKAIELNPKSGNIYRNLAMVYAMKHNVEEARAYLQLAILHDPRNYLTQIAAAQFMIRDGKYTEASELLMGILMADFILPSDKEAYVMNLLAELENLQLQKKVSE
jgi:Flp pilus assembly protein TadD